jgi:predicted NAD/FAD-dependent oxidoreductase
LSVCFVIFRLIGSATQKDANSRSRNWYSPLNSGWAFSMHSTTTSSVTRVATPSPVIAPGLYRCGDYCEDVSINGALLSGDRAGRAVINAIG